MTVVGTNSVHGPGLYAGRATKLKEPPILPLRSLQFSDKEEGHPHGRTISKLTSPLGEMKTNPLCKPDEGEITAGLAHAAGEVG